MFENQVEVNSSRHHDLEQSIRGSSVSLIFLQLKFHSLLYLIMSSKMKVASQHWTDWTDWNTKS